MTGVVWYQFEKKTNKKFHIKRISGKINIEPLKIETINHTDSFYSFIEFNIM